MDELDRPKINLSELYGAKRRIPELLPAMNLAETRKIQKLIEQALRFRLSVRGPQGQRIHISKGRVRVSDGNVTLLRDITRKSTVYIVGEDNLDPADCLIHIDMSTGEAYSAGNTTPYDRKSVIDLLTQLENSAVQPREQRRYRRNELFRNVGVAGAKVLAGAAAVAAIVVGVIALVEANRPITEPIAGERIYDTRSDGQRVEWSEQFQGKDVDQLADDKSERIPADRPSVVTAPKGGVFQQCKTYSAQINEGDRFKAVFHGQRGDGFNIKFIHQNEEIEVCRNGNEDFFGDDDVLYVQRLE
ncbi:hypothetical protein JOF56_008838 [Kibdelosporangium banguiense]|uniref:DUF4115 domain-containing protein n=1 Tax=Kibdelosporangium banguiense TaxID=1365924 RepID=A0ABS4TVR2_9PSEU|nr:hypothetical protein [Kibdelosporangium banguiense]MBP2328453.1 hypothetical protein [Kibdelosporangium banguiense]